LSDDVSSPLVAPEAGTTTKPRRAAPKSARRRSRELALQGLYQWLVAGADLPSIEAHIATMDGFGKADRLHFDALLQGCLREAAELDSLLARHTDRPVEVLSPVEHGILWIGSWEMRHSIEVPLRVVLNEAVELAKTFGGTDGHKFVNGVLDKAAAELRPEEAGAARSARAARREVSTSHGG
jgi:transcription antitermination protein NusB